MEKSIEIHLTLHKGTYYYVVIFMVLSNAVPASLWLFSSSQ